MSRRSGTWGTSRWGEDAWGVHASSVPVACDIGRAAAHASYSQAVSRSYDALDRAKVLLDEVDISAAVFSFNVRLAADRSANMARVTLYKGSRIIVSGGSTLTIKYDGVILFSGKVSDIPLQEGRLDSDITATSPDEILATLPCPDLLSSFYCSALIQQAAGIGGFSVEFGGFQDYFLGLYKTEDKVVREAYLGPITEWGVYVPFSPPYFKTVERTITATVWEAHHFGSLRQAIDTLANSLIRSHVFHVPGTNTLRITNWNVPRANVGSVPQGAMFSFSTRDTTQGRINHLVLTCRDGKTVEFTDAADIAAHGLRRSLMSTQVGNAGSAWAQGMGQSIITESQAQLIQWETVLNPCVMPTDGLMVWTPDGEKSVKVESVEHTLSASESGATSRWTGKVLP